MVKLRYAIFSCYATCADEGQTQCNTYFCYVTCADDVELVQTRDETQHNVHLLRNLCQWGVEFIVHLLHNLCQWGVELTFHLLCNLCKWGRNCTRWGWNSVQNSIFIQLVQTESNWRRWGVEHSTIFCYAACASERWNTVPDTIKEWSSGCRLLCLKVERLTITGWINYVDLPCAYIFPIWFPLFCEMSYPPGVSAPWFCKMLPQTTTDDIEVRICTDQTGKDILVECVKLYIHWTLPNKLCCCVWTQLQPIS